MKTEDGIEVVVYPCQSLVGYMVSGRGALAPGSTTAKLFTNQNPIRGTSGVNSMYSKLLKYS